MEKVFVVSDPHGELTRLSTLLQKWNPDNELLVINGDLIDRGEDPYGVVQLARILEDEYGAIVNQGNHEDMLLQWLDDPVGLMPWYYKFGGIDTINSFFRKRVAFSVEPDEIARRMKSEFAEDIDYIRGLRDYYEWNQYLFVHAGVNLDKRNWKDTSWKDFRWIREPFHYGRNDTGLTIIFGHTRTYDLNEDGSADLWISPCGTKIGIDGGAVFGRLLHGLIVKTEGEYEVYSVDTKNTVSERSFALARQA